MKDSRKSFTSTLLELARNDKDIIAVTTDARGSVTLGDFAKELPSQFVECGIAEQDAVGISAGLAHSGKKVFCCGPACFYVARSLEQVKVDVAYSRNPVKILGVSGGLAYGALGATHHSLHDIAVLRAFPGMNVVLPSDGNMTEKLVKMLVDYPEPVFVRVGRGATGEVYENHDFDCIPGKANLLHEGKDITIIATGETVYPCTESCRNAGGEEDQCQSTRLFMDQAVRQGRSPQGCRGNRLHRYRRGAQHIWRTRSSRNRRTQRESGACKDSGTS